MKRMKNTMVFLLIAAMMLTLSSCVGRNEQEAFDEYTWALFEDTATANTINLNYLLKDPKAYGITASEVTLGEVDFSEEALAEDKKELEKTWKELKAFEYRKLSEKQQLTYDVLDSYMETQLKSYDFIDLYEPFAFTSGEHANMPIVLASYRFDDAEDVEDYLKILELLPDYFDELLEFEKEKSEKGLFMSETCAENVIQQCRDYIANPEHNVLIETFQDRIEKVADLTEQQIQEYVSANHDAVLEYVIPAYENTIAVFEELKSTGQNSLGLAYYEDGQEYYQYLLESQVGTDRTAEEVIRMIEEATDQAMQEMYKAAMADQEGYSSYMENYGNLYKELDLMKGIRDMEKSMSNRFPQIPPIEFTVTPVHESMQSITSPAYYIKTPIDDYQNNSIFTNETGSTSGSLWSTLAHEGIPGHMYQRVYYLSQDPEPIRNILDFNGYTEGWAVYVEMMSFAYYDFEEELYGKMEMYNDQLNLLISARTEIGVNYEGWMLEDVEDYLVSMGVNAEAAQGIMDYVIAEPANYQMYCIGWLEWEALRDYAEEELGDRFDEAQFHQALLDVGPCQFSILQAQLDEYIKSVQ